MKRHLATWAYHCDEQNIDYVILLVYSRHPAEPLAGLDEHLEIEGVHDIESARVWIGDWAAELKSDINWEREIKRRIENLLEESPAVMESAEQACWKDWDAFHSPLIG